MHEHRSLELRLATATHHKLSSGLVHMVAAQVEIEPIVVVRFNGHGQLTFRIVAREGMMSSRFSLSLNSPVMAGTLTRLAQDFDPFFSPGRASNENLPSLKNALRVSRGLSRLRKQMTERDQ